MSPSPTEQSLKLTDAARKQAIDELKRRGKAEWGASYYSQQAPLELCSLAGRPRRVQYGALISWLKRLGDGNNADPPTAIELAKHLVRPGPDDEDFVVDTPLQKAHSGRSSELGSVFEINCPSVVHDHRFVVLGELPESTLHPAVLLQPLDGTGFFYPQVARHNPLRAGRAFSCFVRFGNPGGIWHTKKPPLDAQVRVFALKKEWTPERSERLTQQELARYTEELGVVARKDLFVSRVSVDLLEPTLSDQGAFGSVPLRLSEPRAETCTAPLTLNWKGGAGHLEIREGHGDRVLFQGTVAPGVQLNLRGRSQSSCDAVFEFESAGHYRVRLYPTVWSFVDPPYEWWLDIK